MKRFITILCVVVTILSTLTVTSFAGSNNNENNTEYTEEYTKAEEATKTFPVEISEKRVLKRIEKLNKLLGGKYFTINQRNCGSETNHGCSNCGMVDVVETEWFNKTVGFKPVDWNYYPNHYFLGHRYTWGMSCCGFATYAGWYIYAQKETDNVVYNKKGTYFFNEKNAEEHCKPGDIIRLDGRHSAIYISCNEEGVEVLDCNWRTDGTNCEVRKHIIEYDNYSLMCVSRALNNVGESEYAVKVINPDVSSQNVTIPFREGESVSLKDVELTKVGHYQIGWAKKPDRTKAKYDMDEEFTKSVTLYPVWKEYDNQTLVVLGVESFSPKLLLGGSVPDTIKVLTEIPIGTQENAKATPVVKTVLSQSEINSCVKGNKRNKKYVVVLVRCNKKGEKEEVLSIRYADTFDYEKFLTIPTNSKTEITIKK